MNLHDLHAPFPLEAIHWRAQSLTRDGKKAMALAYIDARDVMDRLDKICGPENWQNEFAESASGRVMCRIGVRIDGEWTWKGDGAGNTDVEAEKGGISDALKRAAVHWGIGRYLYRLPAPWVPCETYEKNGKAFWKKWTDDPWNYVRDIPSPSKPDAKPAQVAQGLQAGWQDNVLDAAGLDIDSDPKEVADAFADAIVAKVPEYKSAKGLNDYMSARQHEREFVQRNSPDGYQRIADAYKSAFANLKAKEAA